MTEVTPRESERTMKPVTRITKYSKEAVLEKQEENDNKISLINFNIGIPICQNVIFMEEITFWRKCMFFV